jgi:hypothetical protein
VAWGVSLGVTTGNERVDESGNGRGGVADGMSMRSR